MNFIQVIVAGFRKAAAERAAEERRNKSGDLDRGFIALDDLAGFLRGRRSIAYTSRESHEAKQPPESTILYRMVAPGRFAPVKRQEGTSKQVKRLLAVVASRKTIVALAAIVFVVAGLFPPWLYTADVGQIHFRRSAGYSFIADPPKPSARPWAYFGTKADRYSEELAQLGGVRVDTPRLLVEWACILVAAGTASYLCGMSRTKKE